MTVEEFLQKYQKVPVEEYPNRVIQCMQEPVVTARIITYQHKKYIKECIESVLAQKTDFSFEILIGEDDSDDGTREICKTYADKYPEKIRLLLNSRENNISINGRPSGKFNAIYSTSRCRGKYVATIEGDDYWTDPLKLQKQVDVMEKHPEFIFCSHDFVVFYEHKKFEPVAATTIYPYLTERPTGIENTYRITLKDFCKQLNGTHTATLLIRHHDYEVEDWVINNTSGDYSKKLIMFKKGDAAFIDEKMSVLRKHPGGMSQRDLTPSEDFEDKVQKYYQFMTHTPWRYKYFFAMRIFKRYFKMVFAQQAYELAARGYRLKKVPGLAAYTFIVLSLFFVHVLAKKEGH